MSNRTIGLSDAVYDYLIRHSLREPELMRRLRKETAKLTEWASMQIAPEQGQFMALLVRLIGARRALEIGTFTGYSSLAVALAMPEDGRLIWIDEALTPDSSRFWPKDDYQPGRGQPSFDKQYVRDYLEGLSWDKKAAGPALPAEVVQRTREKYRDAYARITGKELR